VGFSAAAIRQTLPKGKGVHKLELAFFADEQSPKQLTLQR